MRYAKLIILLVVAMVSMATAEAQNGKIMGKKNLGSLLALLL